LAEQVPWRLSCSEDADPHRGVFQVRHPRGHPDVVRLRLTAVKVSPQLLGAEQRPGRRLVAIFGLESGWRCRLPRRGAGRTAGPRGDRPRTRRGCGHSARPAGAKVSPPLHWCDRWVRRDGRGRRGGATIARGGSDRGGSETRAQVSLACWVLPLSLSLACRR
jgi:hypothetical protein